MLNRRYERLLFDQHDTARPLDSGANEATFGGESPFVHEPTVIGGARVRAPG